MTYKTLLLSAFLVPMSTLSMEQIDVKKSSSEMNDDYEFKLLKLSSIGKMLQEKEELIESLILRISALRTEKEAKGFDQTINDLEKHVSTALIGNEESVRVLTKAYVLKKNNSEAVDKLETGLIQIGVERIIWKLLIEDYKKCLLELFEINRDRNSN